MLNKWRLKRLQKAKRDKLHKLRVALPKPSVFKSKRAERLKTRTRRLIRQLKEATS